MRYIDKYLSGEYPFLEVTVYDEEDVACLTNYKDEKNILISLEYIQYLSYFPKVERLILTSGYVTNDSHESFKALKYLRELKLDYDEDEPSTPWCIDVSVFPKLEYLFSRSSYNFCGISLSETLKTLKVVKWYERDLSRLEGSSLDSLCICSGRLQTLTGIENSSIQLLSLSNLKNLKDISSAEMIPLKILELESCNQIPSLENFSSDTLEYLMVYGKNKVQSGSFILKFKQLKRVMLNVIIEDGDLSFFDSLDHAVILTDKRTFNRTNSRLPKSPNKYVINTIPEWRYIFSDRNI